MNKSRLLEQIVLNAGFLNFLITMIREYQYQVDSGIEPITDELMASNMASLLDSISEEKASELAEVFKVISNRLLDFGLEHTKDYLREGV